MLQQIRSRDNQTERYAENISEPLDLWMIKTMQFHGFFSVFFEVVIYFDHVFVFKNKNSIIGRKFVKMIKIQKKAISLIFFKLVYSLLGLLNDFENTISLKKIMQNDLNTKKIQFRDFIQVF